MSHSYLEIYYHFVWATKKRLPLITSDIKDSLYLFMRSVIEKHGFEVIAMGGVHDHVHVLVKRKEDGSIRKLLRELKSSSAKFVNKAGRDDIYLKWQTGFSGFSVSPWVVDRVTRYINRQEEHHKSHDFENEMEFFKRNL